MEKTRGLVWIDIQTSGLDPKKDVPLEVALAITDLDGLVRTASGYVQSWPLAVGDGSHTVKMRKRTTDYVRSMHSSNGLWHDCDVNGVEISDVDKQMAAIIDANEADYFHLAGRMINFERAWMEVHFPKTSQSIGPWNFDSGAVVNFLTWSGDVLGVVTPFEAPRIYSPSALMGLAGLNHRAGRMLEMQLEEYAEAARWTKDILSRY